MSTYRTSKGQIIDMAALAAKNERTRAVGNMKVNARGDTIDSFGNIITPVTERTATNYAKTVGQRSAQHKRLTPIKKPTQTSELELTPEEKELLNDEEIAQEAIELKAKEQKK